MTYAKDVIHYYNRLAIPKDLPDDVEVLYPFKRKEVNNVVHAFYNKYFDDNNERTFLIGINPGRFGGGITGIPFTDPVRLKEELEIHNSFDPRQELSSRFIYRMINEIGGPETFYKNFYFTSVSPLGFMRHGKNLNYYDIPALQHCLEDYIVAELKKQLSFGARKIAFSLGMGKNITYLRKLNARHQLFEEIVPLPHPRWVMQYRLKRLNEFVQEYTTRLSQFIV